MTRRKKIMSTLNILSLVLMGVVFAVWVILMTRMLWRLTKQSLDALGETGGGYFTWVAHSFRAFGGFFSDPSVASERRMLIWVTILMMLINVARPILLMQGE
jgi:hypothetical protein